MTARKPGARVYRRATGALAAEIRERYASGESASVIAADLGLGRSNVGLIASGATWKCAPMAEPRTRVSRRRTLCGDDHPNAKLSAAEVLDLRARASAGEDPCLLATKLGVSEWCVRLIMSGERWKHLLPGAEAVAIPRTGAAA